MKTADVEMIQIDTQQLAENLSLLIKRHNLTAGSLANKLGLPMMTVWRLATGETTDPRISTLKLIANYFETTIDDLLKSDNNSLAQHKPVKPHFVPILDWNTAQKINEQNAIDLSNWKNWHPLYLHESEPISPNAFGLESRPSMQPRFPLGSLFIIDPNVEPCDGDIILVKINSNNELTLRELTIDPPEWMLHPIAPGSTILKFCKQEHTIVGVNLLTLLYRR